MSGQYIGRIKLKFIGKPNGVLMKGSPGNYTQNAIYSVPASYIQFKYWELVENPPEIKAPEAKKEDSVFGDEVFIPPSEMQATPFIPPTEVTISDAPTPVLDTTIQVGDVVASEPESKVSTPAEAVVTQEGLTVREMFPEAYNKFVRDGLAANGLSHWSPESRDNKPAQETDNVVMDKETSPPSEDKEDDYEASGMPPELVAEMRALGTELPERKVRRRKKVNPAGDNPVPQV